MQVLICDDIRFLISRAFEHDLNVTEARQLAGHLATCPACKAYQARLTVAMDWADLLNGAYGGYSLDNGFGQRLQAAISTRLSPEEALRAFNRQVIHDLNLQGQIKQTTDLPSFVRLYVQLGNALGFRFTDQELLGYMGVAANDWELSDLELDAVVGGAEGNWHFLDKLLNP